MKFGMPELISCPKCEARQWRLTLLSGNTFGAVYYSDGSRHAPKMPDIPFYIHCHDCCVFFKVTDETIKGTASMDSVENIPRTLHLTAEELADALEQGIYNGGTEDIFPLRCMYWRTLNKLRLRMKKISADEDAIYLQNCNELLRLFENSGKDEDLLMKAELCRNIADFKSCKDILEKIKNEKKYVKYIASIKTACDEENIFTVKI